jgi:hypothetical protein
MRRSATSWWSRVDPNSAHQVWSFWEYRVYPDGTKRPPFALVKANCARFGRLVFGSASEMRITEATDARGWYWEVAVRTEGHPVQDPRYTEWLHAQWRRFLHHGFGGAAEIHAHARLEAGDRQDGTPADPLIILPSLESEHTIG